MLNNFADSIKFQIFIQNDVINVNVVYTSQSASKLFFSVVTSKKVAKKKNRSFSVTEENIRYSVPRVCFTEMEKRLHKIFQSDELD